jgi:MYXO-CTERM domain-containing protein
MSRKSRQGWFEALRLAVVGIALGAATASAQPKVDVPLRLWVHSPDFPGGLNFGATNGVSFGDYDSDGWVDVFAYASGNLWRNLGGTTWVVYNINSAFPSTESQYDRYGSAFGDFNNDGFPDIATEPRFGSCTWVIENVGGTIPPTFRRLGEDRQTPIGCGISTETNCWGDVDGDTDLDLWIPAYPYGDGANHNHFYENLGPRDSDGLYSFAERAIPVGLSNAPRGSARPEGAQFVDIDFDGDIDAYTSGSLYQNLSSTGAPEFSELTEAASGILFNDELDEGAAFDDYDLDGDYDVFVVYTNLPVCTQVFENRGDGTFFQFPQEDIESPCEGLNLGLSTADWDGDGDPDFTTREVFRRNQFAETGRREFTVATHTIPADHRVSATPAWADWDKDGDLDCALGDWQATGRLYESTLYDELPAPERRHFRVRTLRDSETVPQGLETEFGSNVELVVKNGSDAFRRRRFTASGHGYLNQNEYTLHFALPADPTPADATTDVTLDVVADFTNLPSVGYWRVDRFVNARLGDIDIADLDDREITVFRSGTVVIDGARYEPDPNESALLTTAGGGLVLADNEAPLARPEPAIGGTEWVGIDFDTTAAAQRVRVREVIVDGIAGVTARCDDAEGNVFLWDVTDSEAPVMRGVFTVPRNDRNDRVYAYVGALLEKDRSYRLIARVESVRATAVEMPRMEGNLTVQGGVRAPETAIDPCDGRSVGRPATDTDSIYASFRYGTLANDPCDECSATERCDFDRCVPITGMDGGVDGGGGRDGGGGSDAGTPGDASSGTDAGPGTTPADDGGCGCSTQSPAAGSFGAIALAVVLSLRRRRTLTRR